jgi:hypothetical protein
LESKGSAVRLDQQEKVLSDRPGRWVLGGQSELANAANMGLPEKVSLDHKGFQEKMVNQ